MDRTLAIEVCRISPHFFGRLTLKRHRIKFKLKKQHSALLRAGVFTQIYSMQQIL